MTKFSVIGHVSHAEYYDIADFVWITTQDGTMQIRFKPEQAKVALSPLIDEYGRFKKDMTSELVSAEGKIRGDWYAPKFEGLELRII